MRKNDDAAAARRLRRLLKRKSIKPKGKAMRKALAVSLLLLAVSAPAYADDGNMLTPPHPQTSTSTAPTGTASTDGIMGDPLAPAAADATTAEAALSLLPTLLALV